jgi:hypothetical protein
MPLLQLVRASVLLVLGYAAVLVQPQIEAMITGHIL